MASDQNQLNYWFGSAAPEMRVTMAGGGPGRIPAEQMLENIRTPAAANDPGMVPIKLNPGYDPAVRQQQIINYGKTADIGDLQYWQKIADAEGHYIGSYTNPYKAAKERSRGGTPSIIIDADGRRSVYVDGKKQVFDRYRDMPK